MSATYGITIDRDGIWAGSGWVDHDGKIRGCPAVLGPDQDASDETYEAIEDAIEEIAEGRDPEDPDRFIGSGSVGRPDGIYSWSCHPQPRSETMKENKAMVERAGILGGNAADAYFDEFGVSPTEDGAEKVGDWDSAAWQTHWRELADEGATDDDYNACLAAWKAGFWV